jgi:hypothetical protein
MPELYQGRTAAVRPPRGVPILDSIKAITAAVNRAWASLERMFG